MTKFKEWLLHADAGYFMGARNVRSDPVRDGEKVAGQKTQCLKSTSSSRTVFGKSDRKNIFNYDPSINFETRAVPLTSELETMSSCKTSDHGTRGRRLE
ncbi:hypothetical protein TNCV_4449951 [Trichonephila clavipes]|nr:hypothetical protein TNCV_4449951 [Trichonephila clavipes]